MTAEEIRSHVDMLADWDRNADSQLNHTAAQVGALWEIATQLAELNERLAQKGSTQAHDRG